VAREGLGTKRVCPETGKKFYDLDKDPIVSPYTGKEYPRSHFEEPASDKVQKETAPAETAGSSKEETDTEEQVEDDGSGPEFVSLEEADADANDSDEEEEEEIPDLPDVDIEVDDEEESDDDVFLEEEESDDDLSDVIGGGVDGEEES